MADILGQKILSAQELTVFFNSMAMLLRAGINTDEGPGVIATDMEEGRLKKVCEELDTILSGGKIFSISEAMAETQKFPEYSVEMTALGETAGRMETTCLSLGRYYHRRDTIHHSIRSAIGGPLLLLVLMSIVLLFLVLYILPVFEGVFESLGSSSAGAMQLAFGASRVVLVAVGVLLLVGLLLLAMYIVPATRPVTLRIFSVLPSIRKIRYLLAAGRLTQGLSMLLASGISGPEALAKIASITTDTTIKKYMPACQQLVQEGMDVGKALVESGALVGFEARILLSAARAGQADIVMERLSEHYYQRANIAMEDMLGIVEPSLVGILSIAIGIVLLSVMLPLTGIMSAIQ